MPVNITTAWRVPPPAPLTLKSLGKTPSPDDTWFFDVAVDSNNNSYYVGRTDSVGNGGDDALVVKYNSDHVLQWAKTAGGSSDDELNCITIDGSDNIFVGGKTKSAGVGPTNGLIMKLNTDGDVQFSRALGTSGQNSDIVGIEIIGTDIYVALNQSFNTIVRLNSGGGTVASTQLRNTAGSESMSCMASDGTSLYTGGWSTHASGFPSDTDWCVQKWNTSLGSPVWQKRHGVGSSNQARDMVTDSSGHLIIVGDSNSGTGSSKGVIMSVNTSTGNSYWSRGLDSPGFDSWGGVHFDGTHVYAVGYADPGDTEGWIGKWTTAGSEVFAHRLHWETATANYFNGVATDGLGNILVAGYTYNSSIPGNPGSMAARVPSDGSGLGTYVNGSFTTYYQDGTSYTGTTSWSTGTISWTVLTPSFLNQNAGFTMVDRASELTHSIILA